MPQLVVSLCQESAKTRQQDISTFKFLLDSLKNQLSASLSFYWTAYTLSIFIDPSFKNEIKLQEVIASFRDNVINVLEN
jgi:hypothetical protein